jgi:hypothetical protein
MGLYKLTFPMGLYNPPPAKIELLAGGTGVVSQTSSYIY